MLTRGVNDALEAPLATLALVAVGRNTLVKSENGLWRFMNNHTPRLESGRFYGGVVVGLQCTGFRIRVSAAVASEGAEAAYKSRIGVVTALAPKIKQHYRRLSTTPHSDKVVLCCEDPITENCLLYNKRRRE